MIWSQVPPRLKDAWKALGRGCLKSPGRPHALEGSIPSEGVVERCLDSPIPSEGVVERSLDSPIPSEGRLKRLGRPHTLGRGC